MTAREMIGPPTASNVPPLREHVGTHADESLPERPVPPLPETPFPPLPGSVPPLPHLTGGDIGKYQVRGKPVIKKTEVPLITPIVLLILGCAITCAPLLPPPNLKHVRAVMFFYVVVGITILLISVKCFAEWTKQRKENASRGANAGE